MCWKKWGVMVGMRLILILEEIIRIFEWWWEKFMLDRIWMFINVIVLNIIMVVVFNV